MTTELPVSDRAFAMLSELLAWRRDVRRFRTDPVPDALVDEILGVVELAPSVGNSQPWRWVRIDSRARRRQIQQHFENTNERASRAVVNEKRALYTSLKLAGLREAPIQFAVFCDNSTTQGGGLGRQTMPQTLENSVVCAIMTFWLAACAKGLGVGWVSILEPETVLRLLDLPAEWSLIAYLCVGYPLENHLDPELERHGWQHRTDAGRKIVVR